MWSAVLLMWTLLVVSASEEQLGMRADPGPIFYPGQVNIGVVADIHEAPGPNSTAGCGPLRRDAVQRAMAAVWAAHQANFRKDDPQELNIGIYIFDTCGREDVAERQIYRLLGHVGHVQTTDCSEKKIPPLFAVLTEGDSSSLKVPLKLLDAFSVPVVSTSGPALPPNSTMQKENFLSTAPSMTALARGAVTVLRQLRLLEVAVIAEDEISSTLFDDFSRQAQVSGMQAIPVDHAAVASQDNFLASLKVVSEYGKSRLKAVVFLVGPEQALDLLHSVDDSNLPQIPWVIITSSDISNSLLSTFKRHELRRFQQVLLLSPESMEVPEFQDYFRQLLGEETIKYHPLLMEFMESVVGNSTQEGMQKATLRRNLSKPRRSLEPNSNATLDMNSTLGALPYFQEADVSSTVKAVWTLASALKMVQRRSCRRGTDCLLYLRRTLSAYVAKAANNLDYALDLTSGSKTLQGTRLQFNDEGSLTSVRYGLKGFTSRGDIQEVGYYTDDSGLVIYHDLPLPFNGFMFKEPSPVTTTTPVLQAKYKLKPESVLLKPTPRPTPSEAQNVTIRRQERMGNIVLTTQTPEPGEDVPPTTLPLESDDYVNWRILDDVALDEGTIAPETGQKVADTSSVKLPVQENTMYVPEGDELEALRKDGNVQSLSEVPGKEEEHDLDVVVVGPSYRSDQQASSNLRSISLTSHHEPRINNAFKADVVNLPPEVDQTVSPTSSDVKVVKAGRNLHVSAWLGRPWALSVLGICGFLILATLYILVFLMVKSCEGSLKKTNSCLAVFQLVSLLCLYVGAALFTWKPSPLLCGLQRLIPNISYSFCYGCLLLKGMHLRAQNSLGLGGSVNRCNQLLTLLFIVGVQVALETQWWLMRSPALASGNLECLVTKSEILESQGYVCFLLLLGTAIAVSTRSIPYNQTESRSLIATTLCCLVVFLSWDVACWLLPDSASRNIAAPSALVATALAVLVGVFGPQLFAVHKYGGFPHKPLSYADSLSTVFTMFKDLDNASSSGTTARGKKNAKTLETPFATEINEGTRNPLYSDYQSAYP